MKTFKDLVFKPDRLGGIIAKEEYSNGYTASIIKGMYSHGGPEGLYEVAVCHGGACVYDTPVTNDVEGHCSEDRVTELMQQIEMLPERS